MPDCWTVRPVGETRTPTPFVVGAWAADFDVDLAAASNPREGKTTEPLTSISWLFWHIGSMPAGTAQLDFLGGDHTTESGWTSPYIAGHPIFTMADEAVGAMRAGWRQLAQPSARRATNNSWIRSGSGVTADLARWAQAPK